MPKSKRPVVILHGYSDKSESFRPLATFLKAHGFKVVDVWLADYKSMNNEISVQDLGQAMGAALKAKKIKEDPHSFDVVVHSTGGLVIRAYLANYFYGKPDACPVRHLLMLAPANFGSPLARLGKSMIGRLIKGWSWDHFLETGTRVLEALELGSAYTWQLAHQDLFDSKNPLFRMDHLYTTILTGSSPYDGMASIAHENGSDGTVRVSTANLNARSFRLNFPAPDQVDLVENQRFYDPIAFGVLYDQNHSSICNPSGTAQKELGNLVLRGLRISGHDEYLEHLEDLKKITARTFARGQKSTNEKSQSQYHEYQTLVTHAHDQFREGIADYFLEFFQEEKDKQDKVMQAVHNQILEKVTAYSKDSSYRSLLFDITDMQRMIFDKNHEIDMSIAVAAKSERIFYQNPTHAYEVFASEPDCPLIQPNSTVLLDIEVKRLQSEDVFRLTRV
jgi:pimeloyl-ACP methyl ester carboxylesterase